MLKKVAKRAAITGGLEFARVVNAAGLMRQARGRGAIFTLHHVRPKKPRVFDPNAHLEITPEFLDTAIRRLKRDGYRFIALDALPAHLASNDPQPVAAFTLDDGYRNNLDHAAPVFSRHGVPFTVFVTGGFINRTDILWWEVLADLLDQHASLKFQFDKETETLPAATLQQKQAAFDRIAAFIHAIDETTAVDRLKVMAGLQGVDALQLTADLTLDEAGLRTLIENPLASLGAHTITHRALARLTDDAVRTEMDRSAARVEQITGRRPASFAYPYGYTGTVSPRDHRLARELGFTTAVTTQPGTLANGIEAAALPRISLNGHFQKAGYVSALASGIAFTLMGRG
ncbi:polysaccharide deacetylase family protein [Pararhizobium sp. BT-229]|uniref:polysaccharide deacetylase family protein n=1 Tax=Pararhizobium sp. BT-229 TaxID=2986923 RepID=UPI0021F76B76|nr:polysaccharide deacetylase family protein [Pararhizobium sp. BT-229]MCV9963114.1 polysaccharide deacetylase family protein [Pararhizobium sp. BT-229]